MRRFLILLSVCAVATVRLKPDTTYNTSEYERPDLVPSNYATSKPEPPGLVLSKFAASSEHGPLEHVTRGGRCGPPSELPWEGSPSCASRDSRFSYGRSGSSRIRSFSHVVSGFSRTGLLSFVMSLVSQSVAAQAPPKQAVVETSAGTFIFDLDPDAAPATVAYFTRQTLTGAYDGTIFHRMVKYGMVQGGDPLTKDPSKRPQYGTGGLNALKAEARAPKMTRGSVAAVLVPGRPDSAGAQFFIVIADQPALDGQYTVFGHVSAGVEVLQKISETPVDDKGVATERVEIRHVTIRDTPPPVPEPFSTEPAAELAAYRAVLETSAGPITIEVLPDKAPVHVRQFLQLAQAGVYDGMAFHRVAPGFVIQTGALASRTAPLSDKQQKLVHPLQPEFNDTKHVKGIVSMARGDDPASATTSFFICTGPSTALDGQYTAFGRVVEGMAAVEAIEGSPRNGETPVSRIELRTVKVVKQER